MLSPPIKATLASPINNLLCNEALLKLLEYFPKFTLAPVVFTNAAITLKGELYKVLYARKNLKLGFIFCLLATAENNCLAAALVASKIYVEAKSEEDKCFICLEIYKIASSVLSESFKTNPTNFPLFI